MVALWLEEMVCEETSKPIVDYIPGHQHVIDKIKNFDFLVYTKIYIFQILIQFMSTTE